jgi:hypothetical protein
MENYNPFSLGAAIPARIAEPIPAPFSAYEPSALADQITRRKQKAAVTRMIALTAAADDAETNPPPGKKLAAPSTTVSAPTTPDAKTKTPPGKKNAAANDAAVATAAAANTKTKTKPPSGKRLVASSMDSQLVDHMMDVTSEAERNLLVSIEILSAATAAATAAAAASAAFKPQCQCFRLFLFSFLDRIQNQNSERSGGEIRRAGGQDRLHGGSSTSPPSGGRRETTSFGEGCPGQTQRGLVLPQTQTGAAGQSLHEPEGGK